VTSVTAAGARADPDWERITRKHYRYDDPWPTFRRFFVALSG